MTKNIIHLVPKSAIGIKHVEDNFDELVKLLKENKIRAFACTAITGSQSAVYYHGYSTDQDFLSLIGGIEIMKKEILKEEGETE